VLKGHDVATINILGQGFNRFVQFVPVGMVVGMFYGKFGGIACAALYVATSRELIRAVVTTEANTAINQDFNRLIQGTQAALNEWRAAEADRSRMVVVQSFTAVTYDSLMATLTTALMRSVVLNFWGSFLNAPTAETTRTWNEYVQGPDLDTRVSRMEYAYRERRDHLIRYYNDFVVLNYIPRDYLFANFANSSRNIWIGPQSGVFVLRAECRRRNGTYRTDTLNLDLGIGNEDGDFRIELGVKDFSRTASNIRLSNTTTLHATLLDRRQSPRNSQRNLNNFIWNDDGFLKFWWWR